jgi:hypothetical protein
MRYAEKRMPIMYVVATDWKLRTAVRAELRERGIDALGMESADDLGRALGRGETPAAIVLEATAELAGDPAIRSLVMRVPTVVVASRVETVPLPKVAAVFYKPVRIGEIVDTVSEILARGEVA